MDRPLPTATATLIGTALLSLITGYFLGLGSSIGLFPSPFSSSTKSPRRTNAKPGTLAGGRVRSEEDSEESSSSEIDDDIILDNAPNWANGVEADRRQGLRVGNDGVVQPLTSAKSKSGNKERKGVSEVEEEDAKAGWEDLAEECKLVLVVRTDLGMTKGKIAAQCSHATLACYKALLKSPSKQQVLKRWERLGQAKIAVQVKSEEEMFELQAKAMSLGVTAEIIADAGRTQIASGSHTVLGVGPAPKSVVDAITGTLKLL